MRAFHPELWEEAPFERAVTNEMLTVMSPDNSATLRFRSGEFCRPPYHSYTLLRSTFDRWLAKKAEEKGAMLVTKNRVDDLCGKMERSSEFWRAGRSWMRTWSSPATVSFP